MGRHLNHARRPSARAHRLAAKDVLCDHGTGTSSGELAAIEPCLLLESDVIGDGGTSLRGYTERPRAGKSSCTDAGTERHAECGVAKAEVSLPSGPVPVRSSAGAVLVDAKFYVEWGGPVWPP